MPDTETTGNGIETLRNELSDRELMEDIWRVQHQVLGAVVALQMSVDHIDTGVHGVRQFIDEHLPLIRRFTDPGAAVRGFLPGAKNAKRKQL